MPRVALTGDGKVTDRRTLAMLAEAQRISGIPFQYAQGSYNGSVNASGTTHHGGGAIDIRTIPMRTRRRKRKALKALRTVGFAAWWRKPIPGLWGEHIHAIAIDCEDLSPSAARQVAAYRAGRNGLSDNKRDPQASLGVTPTTWEAYRRSQRPTKGRATVTHPEGAVVREQPGGHSKVVKRRLSGEEFTYDGVEVVGGIEFLRLASGNFIRSSRTSRG